MSASLFERFPSFFDLEFVRQSHPSAADVSDADLLKDLLDVENRVPLRPNPIFDCSYYTSVGLGVRRGAVLNPIVHYLQQGDFEGVQPNLFFSPRYYRQHTPDARSPEINAVEHALQREVTELVHLHPLVDLDHIRAQLPGMDAQTLLSGLFAGTLGRLDPHPLFLLECLERSAGRLFRSVGEGLAHYLEHPGDLQTHHLFDPGYYLDQLGAVATGPKALIHYLQSSGAVDPHPLFDSVFYRRQVLKQSGVSPDSPLLHFVTQTSELQISPSAFFDLTFYRQISRCGDDALRHYLFEGGFRHFTPHPLIDLDDYHGNRPTGRTVSDIPAVDVALRAQGDEPLDINLFDPDFVAEAWPSEDGGFRSPAHAYFTMGLVEGQLPCAMFSKPYMLRSVALNDAGSDPGLAQYFRTGLHRRQRILFAVPDLEASAENDSVLELLRLFSQLSGVETITLADTPGALEGEFRQYSHVHILEGEASPESAESENPDIRIDRFLQLLGGNKPVIAFCDQPERSATHLLLSARQIPVIPIVSRLGGIEAREFLPGLMASSPATFFHSPAELERARLEVPHASHLDRSACVQYVNARPSRSSGRAAARRRIGVPQDAHVVLGGGGFTLEAGLDEFASVARRCFQAADHVDNLYFFWMGEGSTRPHSLHFYVSLHNTLSGLDGRVQFAPEDVEVQTLCEAADVFLQPCAHQPAMPLVLGAAAAGCPMVICSASGGFDSLFDPAFCFSYAECDLDAARDAVNCLLRDKHLHARCSAAAGPIVRAAWDFDALINRLIDTVNQHASASIELPAHRSELADGWDVYIRGRAEELMSLEVLHDWTEILAGKLICVGGRFEPEIDAVVQSSDFGDHAVYQPEDDGKASLSVALKSAILDQSAAKSLFVDLEDVLTEQALQRCTGRRVLLVNRRRENIGQLYELGLSFDEIYVPQADLIAQMERLNPLIAARMVVLETGSSTQEGVGKEDCSKRILSTAGPD